MTIKTDAQVEKREQLLNSVRVRLRDVAAEDAVDILTVLLPEKLAEASRGDPKVAEKLLKDTIYDIENPLPDYLADEKRRRSKQQEH